MRLASKFLTAPRIVVAVVVLAGVVAGLVVWLAPSGDDGTWPDGVVNVYGPAEMTDTLVVAARQWSTSGVHVNVRVVLRPRDADVFVRTDDRRLKAACGRCLGHSSSIGRPKDGRPVEILIAERLDGRIRPLSVWVAAHELGHVLGLRHRAGTSCALMSVSAFDTRCAPTWASTRPSRDDLVCIPGRADVLAAAKLYGGAPARDDERCD